MKQTFKPIHTLVGEALPYCAAVAVIYGGYHLIKANNQLNNIPIAVQAKEYRVSSLNEINKPKVGEIPSSQHMANKQEFTLARSPEDLLSEINKLKNQ